jgi:hypothetical protein
MDVKKIDLPLGVEIKNSVENNESKKLGTLSPQKIGYLLESPINVTYSKKEALRPINLGLIKLISSNVLFNCGTKINFKNFSFDKCINFVNKFGIIGFNAIKKQQSPRLEKLSTRARSVSKSANEIVQNLNSHSLKQEEKNRLLSKLQNNIKFLNNIWDECDKLGRDNHTHSELEDIIKLKNELGFKLCECEDTLNKFGRSSYTESDNVSRFNNYQQKPKLTPRFFSYLNSPFERTQASIPDTIAKPLISESDELLTAEAYYSNPQLAEAQIIPPETMIPPEAQLTKAKIIS